MIDLGEALCLVFSQVFLTRLSYEVGVEFCTEMVSFSRAKISELPNFAN